MPARVEDNYGPLGMRILPHAYPSSDGLTIFFREVTEERRTGQRFHAVFEQAAVGMSVVASSTACR
jgi:hypothetical protein